MKASEVSKDKFFVVEEWWHREGDVFNLRGFWGRIQVVSQTTEGELIGWDWLPLEMDPFKCGLENNSCRLKTQKELDRLKEHLVVREENVLVRFKH